MMMRRDGIVVLVLGVSLAAGACRKGEYVGDADTGAAAPATKLDPSATPNAGDSALGVTTDRPAGPAIAGDTHGRSSGSTSAPVPSKQRTP
jgi:hypothetical protein